MASCSISGWSGAGGRTLTLEVNETSYNAWDNTSTVQWTLTVSGGGGTYMNTYAKCVVNGNTVFNRTVSWGQGFPDREGSESGTLVIAHESGGDKSISFSIEGYIVQYSNKYADGWLALTNIDRTAPTITAVDATDVDTNKFNIRATSNAECFEWAYRIKRVGGTYGDWQGWYRSTGTVYNFTITGLATNTSYVIQLAGQKSSNGVWGWSNEVSVKTLGASVISSAADILLGTDSVNIKWTPLDSTYKYKLRLSLGSWSYTTDFIAPGNLNEYTYDDYTPELATIAPLITTSYVGSMVATLTTYTSGGAQIGATSVKAFSVRIPESVKPAIAEHEWEVGYPATGKAFNALVKTLTGLGYYLEATGSYGSTITGITLTIDGFTYTEYRDDGGGWFYISMNQALMHDGQLEAVLTVTDSRGGIAAYAETLTVYDYFQPTAEATATIFQKTITTRVIGNIASVNGLNQKKMTIVRRRVSDDTTETYTVNPLPDYSFDQSWRQTLQDAGIETYEYTITIEDKINSYTFVVLTGVICISRLRGGRGVTLFQEAEHEGFWIRDIDYTISTEEYVALASELATAYSVTSTYYEGQFVTYNNNLYEANQNINTPESWTATHWTQIN